MKLHSSAHGLPREPGGLTDDAWRVEHRDETVIAALADGVGSSQAGREAAQRAVAMLVDYYLSRPQAWSPRRALLEFSAQINRLLHQESQLRYNSPELLCTVCAVAIEGNRLYGLNIGDSPVFLHRRGTLTQLTHHHALGEAGLEHVLTRAVGLADTAEPHSWETTLENGDQILLCSDGISNALPPDKLSELLRHRVSAHALVATAREATAEKPDLQDDISAIVLDLVETGWRGATAGRSVEVLGKLTAGQMLDGYQLVRPLQAEARVWLAKNPSGTHQVLKFPPLEAAEDEARRDGFVREMWNATRIHSPDFVPAQTPAAGTLRYYTMDFVEAPTLRDVLQRVPLAVEDVVILAHTLLRGAQFLLTHDLAHGDLKPDNILMLATESPPRFLLLDLGSAAQIFSVTTHAGTATYLAPERFHGGPLSERTEIFAIGVILYEALTRSFPYGEIERFQRPSFEQPPRPPSRLNPATPPWLEAIIQRALAPDPAERYQNFSELVFDLNHPQQVSPYIRAGAPLIERHPVLFYKTISLSLLALNIYLLYLLARR